MILRACVDCGALSDRIRCAKHRGVERDGSTRAWRKVRAAVLKRDGYRCRYCGAEATTVDHVRPVVSGGTDREDNLVAACAECNRAKGDKTLAEFGLTTERDGVTNLALGLGEGTHLKKFCVTDTAHLAGKNSSDIGGRSVW